MAPEQLEGRNVDGRADLYSLACVAYESLVGEPPLSGEGLGDLILKVMREAPTPPSRFVPGLPKGVDELFTSAFAKDPNDRPTHVAAWGDAMAAFLENVPRAAMQGWPEQLTKPEFVAVRSDADTIARGTTMRLI